MMWAWQSQAFGGATTSFGLPGSALGPALRVGAAFSSPCAWAASKPDADTIAALFRKLRRSEFVIIVLNFTSAAEPRC